MRKVGRHCVGKEGRRELNKVRERIKKTEGKTTEEKEKGDKASGDMSGDMYLNRGRARERAIEVVVVVVEKRREDDEKKKEGGRTEEENDFVRHPPPPQVKIKFFWRERKGSVQ